MDEQVNNPQPPRSNKTLYIVIAIIVIIVLGFMFAKGAGKTALEKAGYDVDYDRDGSTTYSTEERTVNIGGNKLPDNWPSDAPEYPNASIQYSASSNPQTGAEGASVVFMTNDSVQAVADFYKKELASRGWKVESTATIGDSVVFAALKDNRTFGIYISDVGNGQTSVTVGIEIK